MNKFASVFENVAVKKDALEKHLNEIQEKKDEWFEGVKSEFQIKPDSVKRNFMQDPRIDFVALMAKLDKMKESHSYVKAGKMIGVKSSTLNAAHKAGTCSTAVGEFFLKYFGDDILADGEAFEHVCPKKFRRMTDKDIASGMPIIAIARAIGINHNTFNRVIRGGIVTYKTHQRIINYYGKKVVK